MQLETPDLTGTLQQASDKWFSAYIGIEGRPVFQQARRAGLPVRRLLPISGGRKKKQLLLVSCIHSDPNGHSNRPIGSLFRTYLSFLISPFGWMIETVT